MELPSFIFGGNTGIKSQGDLNRSRKLVDSLMAQNASRVPQNPWEGINSITRSLLARQHGEQADEYESGQRADASSAYENLFAEGADPSIQALSGLADNEYLGKGKQSVINAMLQQKMMPQETQERKMLKDASGRQRYLDTGDYVFDNVNIEPDVDEYGLPKASSKSQEISLMIQQGIDPQDAIRIVSGVESRVTNPVTGQYGVYNQADQTLTPINAEISPDDNIPTYAMRQADKLAEGNSLIDQAEDAVGIINSAQVGAGNVLGQVGLGIGDMVSDATKEETAAANDFKLFKRNMIQSLSLNPRFPIAEQKRIEDLLPTGAFTSPASLKIALNNLNEEFIRILADNEMILQDPNVSIEERNARKGNIAVLNAAIKRIGIGFGDDAFAPPQLNQGITPSGIKFKVVQ